MQVNGRLFSWVLMIVFALLLGLGVPVLEVSADDGPFEEVPYTYEVNEDGSAMITGWNEDDFGPVPAIAVDRDQGTVSGTIDHLAVFAAIARLVETDEPEAEEPEQKERGEPQYSGPSFADLDSHWAKNEIYRLAAWGAVNGYPDGTFQPDQTMARAEFVTMVVQALNLEGGNGHLFADSEHHWARDAIAAAAEHDIITGYDETIFGVNDPITREQLALIIMRVMKLPAQPIEPLTFTDQSDIANWAGEAVALLQAAGIINGYPDGSFRPKREVTRAEAAVVLVRVLDEIK
ncbi:S-layer homology domain-containing protein [Paenibacillus senegalensis]|uniref:S-layer homology domain-containing protein n=1 Tax=Paenibacillus senegalensis TaxID=1465766 RepID=UPI000287DC1F|nr:S-layer homology domain-containing protein [Paenibacillus senegalensis]